MTADPVAARRSGTVHGFSVTSDVGFVYLREGEGAPLRIVEDGSRPSHRGDLLKELHSRVGLRTRVYERADGFSLELEKVGWFGVDARDGVITMPQTAYPAWLEGYLWGLPTALLALSRGDLCFHASAVEVDGRAVILAGPSHHGKTTLAGAVTAAGHRLLAEDLLRCAVDGPATVYPGPAMLRLRRDVAEWLAVPGAERVSEDPEKVHLALDGARRGTCDPVPLAGILFLHIGDQVSLRKVEPGANMQDLWAVALNLPTPGGRARCFRQIAELARTVPLWELERPLTRRALDPTVGKVVEVARERA